MKMINNQYQLSTIIQIAALFHHNQFDKGGRPYFLHVTAVMHKLRSSDEELNCIAIGHDLLEDTKCDVEYLKSRGISQRVIDGIIALTKFQDQSPEEYMRSIIRNGKDAICVKMADLTHNSDLRRLKGVREKDLQRTIKYQSMYTQLKEALHNVQQ